MPPHWWIPIMAPWTPGQPSQPPPEAPDQGVIYYYDRYQDQGAQRQRWIENPGEPDCPIQLCNLTLDNLQSVGYRVSAHRQNHGYEDLNHLFDHVGLPVESPIVAESVYHKVDFSSVDLSWHGYIGPGLILIEEIARNHDEVHHISELSLAFYRGVHPINTLQHVIVANVVNVDTHGFLSSELYDNIERSQDWWRTWEHGTPEYEALLGTRIGKMVSYIVLGALPRGTRRIFRINTVYTWGEVAAHFHFEIEAV